MLAIELLTLLDKSLSVITIEIAIVILEVCGKKLNEIFEKKIYDIFDKLHYILYNENLDERVINIYCYYYYLELFFNFVKI